MYSVKRTSSDFNNKNTSQLHAEEIIFENMYNIQYRMKLTELRKYKSHTHTHTHIYSYTLLQAIS